MAVIKSVEEKYMKEGKQYYTGTLYIPEDLDVLKL